MAVVVPIKQKTYKCTKNRIKIIYEMFKKPHILAFWIELQAHTFSNYVHKNGNASTRNTKYFTFHNHIKEIIHQV